MFGLAHGTIRDAGWVLSTTLESHAKYITIMATLQQCQLRT